jgi:glycosyltransferase involved in cell wall biosynthesis
LILIKPSSELIIDLGGTDITQLSEQRSLKIAIVIDTCEPFYHGGYERRAWELARILALDHEVSIFTSCNMNCEIEGVKFIAVRPQRKTFSTKGFRTSSSTIRFICGLIPLFFDGQRFDIIDCNATPFLHVPIVSRLARHWNGTMVLTAHEGLSTALRNYANERFAPPILRGTALQMLKLVYHLGMRSGRMIVTPSTIAAKAICDEGYENVMINHGGVGSIGAAKTNYLGRVTFVGRLVPSKRVEVLIRAAQLAGQQGWMSSLNIVGTGPQRAELIELANSHQFGRHIYFHGDVDEERKFEILRNHTDLFVSASLREGISLVTLEAMSMANPVIISTSESSTSNGALEYVKDGENGFVTGGDEAQLVASIRRVSRMENGKFHQMSEMARQVAQKHLWKPGAEELVDLYRSLLSSE